MSRRLGDSSLIYKRFFEYFGNVLPIVSITVPRFGSVSQAIILINTCPSGYFLFAGSPGQAVGDCLSNVPEGMVLTYGSTAYDDSTSWSMATTTLAHPSTVGAIAIKGWNVNIPETTSTSTPTPTSTRATTSISTTGSPSTTAATNGLSSENLSASNSGSSEELSTGAKAGIGIGAAVGAIGIIALLVALYFFRQKKQRPQLSDAPFSNPSPMAYQRSETTTMRSEVPYQYHYTAELDGTKSPAELGPGVRSPRF